MDGYWYCAQTGNSTQMCPEANLLWSFKIKLSMYLHEKTLTGIKHGAKRRTPERLR